MKRTKVSIAFMLIMVAALQLTSLPASATSINTNLGAPYVTYVEDAPGSGRYLATINLRPDGYAPKSKATFYIYYGANPSGYLVNIGDSSTNNAGGGDASTQSNDAELEITDGVLTLFYNDTGTQALGTAVQRIQYGAAVPYGGIKVEVTNNTVTYTNFSTNETFTETVSEPYSFALDGRSDSEGPVNYTIYLGINRVVDGDYRSGSGVDVANIIVE